MSESPITSTNGVQVVYGSIGETVSNTEMIATDKKYKFATRRNCSYNPFGTKVTALYFPVLIAFPRIRPFRPPCSTFGAFGCPAPTIKCRVFGALSRRDFALALNGRSIGAISLDALARAV